MKPLKLISLLLSILTINSCSNRYVEDEIDDRINNPYAGDCDEESRFYLYMLSISFQDVSGNDLVDGIGFNVWVSDGVSVTGGKDDSHGIVKHNLYTLEYVYEDGIPNTWKADTTPTYIPDIPDPYIEFVRTYKEPERNDNYCYLSFSNYSLKIDSDFKEIFAEKITIKLKCSYIFSDNEEHEIVTWWKILNEKRAMCDRIEFEGKEFTVKTTNGYQSATLGFDR